MVALRTWVLTMLTLFAQPVLGASAQTGARFVDEAEQVSSVLALIRDRLALMPAVAAYKWQHQLPIYDGAREQALLDQLGAQAERLGLEPEPTRALFALQMRLARALQERALARFREQGLGDQVVLDLQKVLRPRLDRIGGELLRALALAVRTLQEPGFAQRHQPEAAGLLAPLGVRPEEARELVEALAQLRAPVALGLEAIRARKVLRVGTTGDYAPFSVEQKGRLQGADVALAQSFARSLGLSVQFVRTSWSTLLSDVQRGAFDLAAGGISITPERSAFARFSLAYHHGGKTAIARCENSGRLDSLAALDRPSVRVIVNPGGTNEAFARQRLAHATLSVFPDNRGIFTELLRGRADVMITDDVEVALQTKRHPELCRTTTELFAPAAKGWLLPADSALLELVDQWLAPRIADGSVAKTLARALR